MEAAVGLEPAKTVHGRDSGFQITIDSLENVPSPEAIEGVMLS